MALHILDILQSPKMDRVIKNTVTLLRKYFRVSISGVENIPTKGPIVVVANHSGIAGMDAVILLQTLNKRGFGQTKVLAHWAYFKLFYWLRVFAQHWGLCETSVANATKILKESHCMIIFPEGETGNFKPSSKMYQLQHFHTGAIRIAQEAKAKIIPAVIIGAEESHINLKNLDLSWLKKNLRIPIPLNFFPLPSKWHIKFGKPFNYAEQKALIKDEKEFVQAATRRLRRVMQAMVDQEVKNRTYIYSPQVDKVLSKSSFLSRLLLRKRSVKTKSRS